MMDIKDSREFISNSNITETENELFTRLKAVQDIMKRKPAESMEKKTILGLMNGLNADSTKEEIYQSLRDVYDMAIDFYKEKLDLPEDFEDHQIIYRVMNYERSYMISKNYLAFYNEPKNIEHRDFQRREDFCNPKYYPDTWLENFLSLFLSKIFVGLLDSIN